MNLSDILAIRANRNVEEVREQINNLEAEFDVAVGAVTVDSEVVLARGGETTLGNRLDKQVSELSNLKTLKQPRNFPTLPYKIYKDVFEKYSIEDVVTDKEKRVQCTYYVNKSSGLDTNSGLTEELALKTIKKAMQNVQNNNTYTHYMIVVIGSSTFYQDELAGEVVFTNKTCLIRPKSYTDRIVLHGGMQGLSWSLSEGYTNTYQTTSAVTMCGVLDCRESNKDYYGLYKDLKPVTSIALVESTAGSYYLSADKLIAYVHLADNSSPDANVWGMRDSFLLRFNHNAGTGINGILMKNIDCIGVNIFTSTKSTITGTGYYEWICENCTFQHGIKGDLVGVNNYNFVMMIDCIGGYALKDLFNYAGSLMNDVEKSSALIIEINCKYHKAGIYGQTTIINNLSTCHNGLNVLRCGTAGLNARGPLIADVNGCRSVNIDCNVYDNLGVSPSAFLFDNVTAHRLGDVTLDNCAGFTTATGSYALNSACKTELINWKQFDKITASDVWIN